MNATGIFIAGKCAAANGVDRKAALEQALRLRQSREILRFLGLRGYLTTWQLCRLFADVGEGGIRKRLYRLRTAGMVSSERQMPGVWHLDRNGAHAFRRLWPEEKVGWRPRYTGHGQVRHVLHVNEIWLRALEAAAAPWTTLARVAWLDERDVAIRIKDGWFRPDALLALRFASEPTGYSAPYLAVEPFVREGQGDGVRFCLPAAQGYRTLFCWVEADTGTQDPCYVAAKAERYRLAFQEGAWRNRFGGFGAILLVAGSEKRALRIARGWEGVLPTPFAVSTWENLGREGLLGQIWWQPNRSVLSEKRPGLRDLLSLLSGDPENADV